jgi:glycerophosphoryl diester phosphodiesterase
VTAWWASPLVVGHRGGRGEGWPPENTLEAFDKARSQGARAIELDVRTCAGGEVVVFHDETLDRMTRGRDRRRVSDVLSQELARADLGGGANVPTLADVLSWARSHAVAVNVEMKHEVPSRAALARATVGIVRSSGADVLLSSFDPALLGMAWAFDPDIPRALLAHAEQAKWAGALQSLVRPPLVDAVHLEHVQADAKAVARIRARGLRVGAWTVNEPSEAIALAARGVSSIITDAPGVIAAALSRT